MIIQNQNEIVFLLILIDTKGDPKQSLSIALEALVNCEFILELMEGADVSQLRNSASEQLKTAKNLLSKYLFLFNRLTKYIKKDYD